MTLGRRGHRHAGLRGDVALDVLEQKPRTIPEQDHHRLDVAELVDSLDGADGSGCVRNVGRVRRRQQWGQDA